MKKLLEKLKSKNLEEMWREYLFLRRYGYHYHREILWYVFMGILGTVVSLAGGLLSKVIIDTVTGKDMGGIVVVLVFFVLMQIFRIVFQAVSGRISAKINIRVGQEITAEVYDKLLHSDWEELASFHSGDLITRLMGDVSTAAGGVLGLLPDLITRALQFIGTLAVILYYDPTMALLALLSAPVTLLLSRYVIKMMRHHNKRMRAITSEMTVFNEESLQNLQMLKAFDRTDAYSEKHRAMQEKMREASLEYNRFSIRKHTIMALASAFTGTVCFLWAVYRLWSGHITFGTMALFLQMSGSLAAAFAALAGLIPGFIAATTAVGRIMEITSLKNEDRSDLGAAEEFWNRGKDDLALRAEGLSYRYKDGAEVLKEVSFRVESGSLVAVVGPSGEGKTTLLRLLLGVVVPQSGALWLEGEQGRLTVSAATRRFFSYVPQGNTLFSGTVRENLRTIRTDATEEDMYEALRLACAEDFILALPQGLDAVIGEQGGGFSEGQLQRICIARALLSPAPILLLDEATSALDEATAMQLLTNLRHDHRKRTVILTTHRQGVQKTCDRVYRIRGVGLELIPENEK